MNVHQVIATLTIVLYFVSIDSAQGFQCYSCEYSAGHDSFYNCVSDPAQYTGGANTVECADGNVCYSKNQYLLGAERINSFSRGCAPNGHFLPGCQDGAGFDVCVSVCDEAKCNDGNPRSVANSGGYFCIQINLFILTAICAQFFY